MSLDDKLRDLHGELDRIGAPRAESTLADDVDELARRRVEAYESGLEPKIHAFHARYGIKWPSGRRFWIRLHRSRLSALSGVSDEARDHSRAWLDERAHELGELFWDESRGLELEGRFPLNR